jgi:hypothetical protein
VASGWRPHRWASFAEYEQVLIAKYGSVERGRLFLAFNSPHETGLACDFGCGGLMPVSATIHQQQGTLLWKWLIENAWQFGFTPYKIECWHWESRISLSAFASGIPDVASSSASICSPDDPNCVESDEGTSS